MDNLDFNNANNQQENNQQQQFDINKIKSYLLNRIEDVLLYLLPNGKIKDQQFRIGNIQGNKGKSLIIDLKGKRKGDWFDFATNQGGDIINLWQEVKEYQKSDFQKLLNEISEWLGNAPTISKKETVQKLPPIDTLGKHSAKWDYLDKDNNLIACIYRYDTETGKEFRVWDVIKRKLQAPDIRPLYNIPGILNSKEIVIVEGEKSADVIINTGLTATTAMFGANAPLNKTDWSPLKDKEIIIWPDNDEAGINYANKLADHLQDVISSTSISILIPPEDKKDKWDAHDAVEEDFDIKSFLATSTSKTPDLHKIIPITPTNWNGTPPQREWLINNWLPKGYVTALYGDGGVGKSLLAQQLMTCLATGKDWLNHQTSKCRVYGLMCEDDESELWRRQIGINQSLNLNMKDLSNMCFTSRIGQNNFLMTFDGKDIGALTQFFNDLLKEVTNFKADLVVLDTAADLFGGNEINRIQVRQFIQNACGNIARAINGSVLLCAHPSDSGIQRKTGTGGSTAWNNTVRSRWYLSYPDEEDVNPNHRVLSRKKSNYASIGNKIDLIYKDGALVDNSESILGERVVGKKQGNKLDAERKRKADVILNLIEQEALQGKLYTINQFAEHFEGKAGLGGKEIIRKSLHVYATKSFIRFIHDTRKYNMVQPKNSRLGYICTKDMLLKVRDKIDQNTGEVVPVTVPIYPSHYKHSESGAVLPVEDPKIWVNSFKEGVNE